MKKILFSFIALVLSSNVVVAECSKDVVPVTWYSNSEHQLMTVCNAQYYVEGNTLYVNQEFKTLSFIYSDNSTGKMILRQRSLYFNHSQKSGGYWYVKLYNGCVEKPANSHLTGIVLRNCQTKDSRNITGVCPDAYLYNTTKEINHSHGSQILNSNLQKIYKYVKLS